MPHYLALVLGHARHRAALLREEMNFRRAHPDAILGQGVLLSGTGRITAGARLFLDRRAYLNPGNLNGGRGYIQWATTWRSVPIPLFGEPVA
jgi:hypothetical protein